MRHHVALACLFALLVPACTSRGSEGDPDAGTPALDASSLDAGGPVDAGPRDAGSTPDAGSPDGGATSDASVPDAGAMDGGAAPDGGSSDCSPTDLGRVLGIGVAMGDTSAVATTYDTGCAGDESSPAVFYQWTAPAAGDYTIDTYGSAFDTALQVREGGCSGAELGCNDDSGGLRSRVEVTLTSGQAIVIALTGFDMTASGAYTLSITETVASEAGSCFDTTDNDRDGAVDCNDSDCASEPMCTETMCTDGADNDGDGNVDCDDFDCRRDPSCIESSCTNGVDDDGDGATDCDDFDCARDSACVEADCGNGADDDGDGAVDCADFDCSGDASCIETRCADGVDDESDGYTDCEDTDCGFEPECAGLELCWNRRDDDGDGRTDCVDTDCATHPDCLP